MLGLLELEKRAWMTDNDRKRFFQLLDVPKHLIDAFSFKKEFLMGGVRDEYVTVECIRPFVTLPRWLKNRIKYRLRHPTTWNKQTMTTTQCILGTCKCHSKINFNEFVERIISNE